MSRKSPRSYYVDGELVAPEAAVGGPAETPSRTARKNASEDLQKVGEALVDLRTARFEALSLPEKLRDAVVEAKRLTSFGARRRQVQFIGKLMRRLEPEELEAVHEALRAARADGAPRPRDGRR